MLAQTTLPAAPLRSTSATAAPSKAAQDPSAVLGYFKYHGFWAPGVRLFRSVSFRAKALFISLAFALPLLLLGLHSYEANKAARDFVAGERAGVAAMIDFSKVYAGTLAARNAVRAGLGGHDTGNDYVQARQSTDAALAAMVQKLKTAGDPLALLPSVEKLKAAWDETAAANGGVDANGRTVFGPVTKAATELLNKIGDDSGLVLDPDFDSFYMINALVLSLPSAVEDVGQLWGWGAYAAGKGGVGEANVSRWYVWSAGAGNGIEETQRYFERARNATPSLKAEFSVDALAAAIKFARSLDKVALGKEPLPPAAVYADGRRAVADVMAVYDRALPALDGLLAARETKLVNTALTEFGTAIVCLLLALYLFISFQKVLNGGLKEVSVHLRAMRDGDLSTTPRPWGKDEAAQLMISLSEMQHSLRAIVRQVRGASENIVHASSEIADGALDLSSRTEQSAANLQQSASAMEEISSTVRQTADNADEASGIARSNAQVAERGGRIIGTMVSTMEDIHASSRKIGDIIGTIDGIAFQTNILALNAAVEAARAGDAGRGFAVVAGEVRQLAQRSAAAAREIKGLITASVEKVESGTAVVRQAGDTIGEIVTQAKRVDQLLAEIATGAKEQAAGVNQTSEAVQQMDTSTQQNAALVEQTAAAASSMKDQAHALAAEVSKFKLAV